MCRQELPLYKYQFESYRNISPSLYYEREKCSTAPLRKKHIDTNSALPQFAGLTVLHYPCLYSSLFNLQVCGRRRRRALSRENWNGAGDKRQLIWLQDMYSPKHKFITFSQGLLVWLSRFECFFTPDNQEDETLHAFSPPQPWHFYPLHSSFWSPALSRSLSLSLSGVFILSAVASAALTNLSSRTESHVLVKAASLEFNTFLWHGRLGSHDHAVPWPLTRGAQTILLSAPIGLDTAKEHCLGRRVRDGSGISSHAGNML